MIFDIVMAMPTVVGVIAAGVGMYVALAGLNTWRRQLKGKVEYDLAKRLLVTLFKYRDAIKGVRHPAMWLYEMPHPPQEKAAGMSQPQIDFYGMSEAYFARWDKVKTERLALDADLLEAEALWGIDLKNYFKVLYRLERKLSMCIADHLKIMNPDTLKQDQQATRETQKKRPDILYDDLSEDGDEYTQEFTAEIDTIVEYLKPKLQAK